MRCIMNNRFQTIIVYWIVVVYFFYHTFNLYVIPRLRRIIVISCFSDVSGPEEQLLIPIISTVIF